MHRIIRHIEKMIIKIIARLIPLKVLQFFFKMKPNVLHAMLLQRKCVILLKRKEVEQLVNENQYINFGDNKNEFSAFNMCYFADALGKALFAIAMSCNPKLQFLDFDGENYYETFFRITHYQYQIELCSENKYDKVKKFMPGPAWFMDSSEIKAYHKIYEYYFNINAKVEQEFMEEYRRIKRKINNKKIIGVVVRGTDYTILKPSGHPIQPDINEVIQSIKKISHEDLYIYLATDEKKTLELFYDIFGSEHIITSESMYYDDVYKMQNANVSRLNFSRDNDKYLKGLQYFKRVYILAKCSKLIGAMSGAVRAAIIIADKPDILSLINKGIYK